MRVLRQQLEQHRGPFTVVHLGDIAANTGLQKEPEASTTARIDQLLGLVQGLPNGRIYFLPGDKDWDNSGPDGLKRVKRLEEYIEQKLPGQNAFLPTGGCPGPEIVDLAPNVRLVAINSPWWTHPYDRPEAPDTECKTMTKEEFREQLQDVLDDTKGKNVLLVGHQPVISNGVYGGRMPLSRQLFPFENGVPLPVFGTLYSAYRQNVGLPRDLANPAYQELRREMLNTLQEHPGVVYAAAHDYSLQLTRFEDNYHLVAGSFTEKDHVGAKGQSMYNAAQKGYSRLDYYADGTVKALFYTFDKAGTTAGEAYSATLFQSACTEPRLPNVPVNFFIPECPTAVKGVAAPRPDAASQPTVTLAPGPQYKAGPGKRFFLGPGYRTSWTQPVAAKTLDLATEKGGLRIFGKGGGRQTTSVKIIAADSSEYVFRSVDKDVTKILPPELRNSVAADVLRDITPTAHPYSALVAGSLLDRTDILHARPRLFVLPDNNTLGPYREKYAGLFGTLEDRPGDPKPNLPGFGGADEVRRSFSFFRQLYKDHDNRIDAPALAKARAFDMLVADFGKHEDNWKWAGFKQGKTTVFRPIPRDRDQSFTLWNGLLTYTANREWAVPSIEDFQSEFHDMESLNWPARHLDRFLLTSLTREQWQEAGRYLQQRITPAAIDQATAELPKEIQPISGQDLNRKLKDRIQELPKALDEYYLMLARRVDVVGSNKAEVFQVDRQPDGNVRVRMFDKGKDGDVPSGEPLFDRTFKHRETDEVAIYGLDGKDVFTVTGTAPKSVLVRIIGGDGKDKITDESSVSGLRTKTKIYDVTDTELKPSRETDNHTSDKLTVNHYDREAFEYDGYNPRATLIYNRNDGFGIGAGFDIVRQGFRKPDYKNLYGIDVRGSSNGNFQVALNMRQRHAIGTWDIGARTEYGNFFPFYNFFGLGNNTAKDETQFDNGYYTARYKGYTFNAFTEHVFFQRSRLRFGPAYEQYTSSFAGTSLLGQLQTTPQPADVVRPNTAFQRLVGLNALLDLDLRDRKLFARRGVRLLAQHDTYHQLNRTKGNFGLTQGFAEYYGTARLLVPVTLVVKGGGARNYGDNDEIPFYKFTSLGQRENLRGYYRNRFSGDASLYLNTEIRLALGRVQTSFLPFSYGVFGFYDRGRVYFKGNSPGGWHDGYGAGFFIAPVSDQLALSVSYQKSPENGLIQFGVGFRIDQ
ncbi:metallophosphoesterase [Hymenobacter fastidiosus]|uniref:Metallophosphoesterase n=1 Tax=Hymenobacter fastidiosus TaxID=486264 RepID=A0ABP7RGQ2_9BACT